MFSKFKKLLNIIQGNLFQGCFIIFVGILFKLTIFLPCLVYGYPLLGGQVIPEDIKSFQVAEKIPRPHELLKTGIGSFTFGKKGIMFQVNEFAAEGVSEGSGGFIKFGNVVNAESVFVSDPPSNECTNNSKATGNDYKFVGTKIHFWLSLLFGGFLGLVIGATILHFIFYLITQQLIYLVGIFSIFHYLYTLFKKNRK